MTHSLILGQFIPYSRVNKDYTHWEMNPGIQVSTTQRVTTMSTCSTILDLGIIHTILKGKKDCDHLQVSPGIQV